MGRKNREELERVRAAISLFRNAVGRSTCSNRIEGMSYSQISEQCGISVKAVEKHTREGDCPR